MIIRKYAVSIRVGWAPVMCGHIEAESPAAAREAWERKFWSDPVDLRAALPSMDETNRRMAEEMLVFEEKTRAEARQHGLTVTARLSKARS